MKDRVSIDELNYDLETGMYPEDEQAQKQLEKECREEVLADPDRGMWLREIIADLNHDGRFADSTWSELFDSLYVRKDQTEFGMRIATFIYPTLQKRIQEETESRINRAIEARKDDYRE